eukprot:757046-Hanusia_phi.AAC.2
MKNKSSSAETDQSRAGYFNFIHVLPFLDCNIRLEVNENSGCLRFYPVFLTLPPHQLDLLVPTQTSPVVDTSGSKTLVKSRGRGHRKKEKSAERREVKQIDSDRHRGSEARDPCLALKSLSAFCWPEGSCKIGIPNAPVFPARIRVVSQGSARRLHSVVSDQFLFPLHPTHRLLRVSAGSRLEVTVRNLRQEGHSLQKSQTSYRFLLNRGWELPT